MEKFKLQRQTLKSSLTRIYNACTIQNITISKVKVRVDRANEVFTKFEAIQEEIDFLTTEKQQAQEEAYRKEIEEKYFSIKALYIRMLEEADGSRTTFDSQQPINDMSSAMQTLMEHQGTMGALIERLSRTTESASSAAYEAATQRTSDDHGLRLPQIQIPEFDGTCTDWIRFRDLFETLVHNRTHISDVEKIEYLQTKIKGEALSLIKHLKPTQANYEIAWQLLKKKYDRSDKVKKAYLELLFDQRPMKSSSVAEAKRIYNTTNESINALRVLDEPVQHWDSILIFNLEKKVDADTLALWYREKKADETATFQHFLDFLEKRVFELENTQTGTSHTAIQNSNIVKRTQSRSYSTTVHSCPLCSKEHLLYNCIQFKDMDVEARRKVVQRSNACFNCLQTNHRASNCKRSSCRKCNGKHNTLLHRAAPSDKQNQQGELQVSETTTSISVNSLQQYSRPLTLLPTAKVMIYNGHDKLQPCRALLDSGSQATLFSEACVQRLHLKRRFDKTMLYGVGSTDGNSTKGRVHVQIRSTRHNVQIGTEALCLTNLTQNLPECDMTNNVLKFFENLDFADPSFYKAGKVDIILGADVFTDCILPEKLTHPTGSPTANNTIFG